jgi:hypothetical protein
MLDDRQNQLLVDLECAIDVYRHGVERLELSQNLVVNLDPSRSERGPSPHMPVAALRDIADRLYDAYTELLGYMRRDPSE